MAGRGKSSVGPGDEYYEEVLLPAESIYEGTWASGPPPPELVDYELMRHMGWSWQDLQGCPEYVRRYCWDFMQARRAAENTAALRERRRHAG